MARSARKVAEGRRLADARPGVFRGAFVLLVVRSRQAVLLKGTVRSVLTGKVKWYDAGTVPGAPARWFAVQRGCHSGSSSTPTNVLRCAGR